MLNAWRLRGQANLQRDRGSPLSEEVFAGSILNLLPIAIVACIAHSSLQLDRQYTALTLTASPSLMVVQLSFRCAAPEAHISRPPFTCHTCSRPVSRQTALRAATPSTPTSTITTQEGEGRSLTLSTTTAQGQGPATGTESLNVIRSFLQAELASIFNTGVCLGQLRILARQFSVH